MKFKDFVNRIAEGVQITISIKMFGVDFLRHTTGVITETEKDLMKLWKKKWVRLPCALG